MDKHIEFMKIALKEAQKAYDLGEIPVGAIITKNDEIISSAFNRRETGKNAVFHAETEAIYKACEKLGGWRLWECSLYVTLEPCPMCAGAIVQARIPRCVVGTMNPKAGCAGSVMNLLDCEGFNHQVEFEEGVLHDECQSILQEFFKDSRIRLKEGKA